MNVINITYSELGFLKGYNCWRYSWHDEGFPKVWTEHGLFQSNQLC